MNFYYNPIYWTIFIVNLISLILSGFNIYIFLKYKKSRNLSKKWVFYLSMNIFFINLFQLIFDPEILDENKQIC